MEVNNTRKPRQSRLAIVLAALLMASVPVVSGCGAASVEDDAAKQADYHYQMAVSHFSANEIPQAIRELTLSIDQRPDHAEALHLMGFIYMGRKQYTEAVRYFRAALEVKPDYFICLNNLGVAFLYMERWEEASQVYEELRGATLYTSPWLAYANLGWAYYKMGRIHDGIEQTKMALFLNPDMCLASNNLGVMQVDRSLVDEAVVSFELALEQCPSYAEPHLHMGHLWADAGDTRKAYGHYKQCMELTPRTDLGERCRKNAQLFR